MQEEAMRDQHHLPIWPASQKISQSGSPVIDGDIFLGPFSSLAVPIRHNILIVNLGLGENSFQCIDVAPSVA
jgi:hypothetical protein